MTEQATKPHSESNSDLLQGKPPRTWRPIVLWSSAILLALGLAWFVGSVAVPFFQTRALLDEARLRAGMPRGGGPGSPDMSSDEVIRRLGGPDRAARMLRLYLRMPDAIAEDKSEAIQFLCSCGRPAIPGLITALDYYPGPNEWCGLSERCMAIHALGKIGPDASEALPHLLRMGGKESSSVAEALGNIGIADARVMDHLIGCLYELDPNDPEIRRRNIAAAEALGKLGPAARTAVPKLLDLLQTGQDPAVRLAAIDALGAIGPRAARAVPELCTQAYEDNNGKELRLAAARALARIGLPSPDRDTQSICVGMLQDAAKDGDPEIATAAASALKKIRGGEAPE